MGVFSNTHRRRVCSHVFQEFQISSIVNKIRC
jgi:hypothetical protein